MNSVEGKIHYIGVPQNGITHYCWSHSESHDDSAWKQTRFFPDNGDPYYLHSHSNQSQFGLHAHESFNYLEMTSPNPYSDEFFEIRWKVSLISTTRSAET